MNPERKLLSASGFACVVSGGDPLHGKITSAGGLLHMICVQAAMGKTHILSDCSLSILG